LEVATLGPFLARAISKASHCEDEVTGGQVRERGVNVDSFCGLFCSAEDIQIIAFNGGITGELEKDSQQAAVA
jgi:hypothetical protein